MSVLGYCTRAKSWTPWRRTGTKKITKFVFSRLLHINIFGWFWSVDSVNSSHMEPCWVFKTFFKNVSQHLPKVTWLSLFTVHLDFVLVSVSVRSLSYTFFHFTFSDWKNKVLPVLPINVNLKIIIIILVLVTNQHFIPRTSSMACLCSSGADDELG